MRSTPSTPLTRLARYVATTLGCASLAVAAAHAQAAAPANPPPTPPGPATPPEAPIQLTAFEVTAEQDVGYQAGNTTSGSRLNTSLKDTAAAVMVFTPEFLSDFNANNLADIVGYSPNMQVDLLDTSADANPQFLGGSDLRDTRIRVRGLSASTALDFFETGIAIDNYNTERFELSSGPNSILFGFGSPGGLVNVMSKRAQLLRNRTSVRLQFGDFDFSRFEVDHNQVIVRDKLALRLNGLHQNGGGWRTNEFNDSSRGAVSLRAAPWKNTAVTVNYENGEMNASVARPINAYDALALWQASGAPVRNDATWVAADRALGINRITAVRNTFVTDAAGTPGFVLTSNNTANFRLLESTYENNNLPANDRAGLTLVPASQLPYRYNAYGPGATRDVNLDRLMARIEQRVNDQISFELAYNREKTGQLVVAPQGNQTVLGGDPNAVLPNTSGTGAPIPNPNAGQLFVESRWVGDRGAMRNEVFRGAVAAELDLGKFGRHKLAGLAEHGVLRAFRYPLVEILVDENGVPIGNAAIPENAANFVFRRHYVNPADLNTFIGGDVRQPISVVRNGRTYRNTYIDGSVAGGDIERTMDTLLAATQSSFFENRFIFTGGVRWDRIRFDQYGSTRLPASHPDVVAGRRIANTLSFTNQVEDTTRFDPVTTTLGGVFHATKVFSVFYNHGTNNSQPPLNVRVLPDETLPPPFEGVSDDFGFMLNLLDGKVFLRATAFQTSQEKSSGGTFSIGLNSGENNIVAPTTRILDTLLAAGRISQAEYQQHLVGDESNLQATSDIRNKGYELSAWFNVTRNLTGVFNFSYTETDRSSIAPEFEGWYERERAFWLQTAGAGGLVNGTSGTTVAGDADLILEIMRGIRDFYSFGYGERPYKANVSARYAFSEGRLRGAFAGAGLRWQSEPKLGRQIVGRNAAGNRIFGETIYGPEDFKMDAFVGYRRKLALRSFRPEMTVQLNVTNLTDEDEVMPLRYNPAMSGYSRVMLMEPRKVRFTVGLQF
jgi:outer membrane receptor protein involved in Fe transport